MANHNEYVELLDGSKKMEFFMRIGALSKTVVLDSRYQKIGYKFQNISTVLGEIMGAVFNDNDQEPQIASNVFNSMPEYEMDSLVIDTLKNLACRDFLNEQ